MDKYFWTYEDIHETVRDLAVRIENSGFGPDIIVAIGSGGFIPARILRTYIRKPILAVGIAYYDAEDRPTEEPRTVQWIEEAERKLAGKRILLVDEVDDSRATLEYCVRELLRHGPAEVAVAVLHDKKKEKMGRLPSEVHHYFAGRTLEDRWIVYPWDALDIREHDELAARASGDAARASGDAAHAGR
jgi:hypoxanthine phosphoribosyltransferase